ncbi:uncharacterized protein MONOS_15318 [Monocercomonoides exilis]|uniref:uncharacterized protein n=1 Tax=Monocercomonoides exilis TaxID=2049356 RepID=UPI00355A7841|nr:hypothetical protein MONOS_15318 [Monocercomonoides exilis]|eukprot:MONOS_15318.1-p1 / transcript=MONOS_15318.1 / gene=MONOS_15318 / organism=Monocercomonoides_exilis_PA203 / gene_product=unspecified product / transcript_product=unspecified product / location=Mono_scaffold01197:9476-10250(+) / protein_length=148 / sequence_SO=supercontig / SO=protein_coding / is_pseudo=false
MDIQITYIEKCIMFLSDIICFNSIDKKTVLKIGCIKEDSNLFGYGKVECPEKQKMKKFTRNCPGFGMLISRCDQLEFLGILFLQQPFAPSLNFKQHCTFSSSSNAKSSNSFSPPSFRGEKKYSVGYSSGLPRLCFEEGAAIALKEVE